MAYCRLMVGMVEAFVFGKGVFESKNLEINLVGKELLAHILILGGAFCSAALLPALSDPKNCPAECKKCVGRFKTRVWP